MPQPIDMQTELGRVAAAERIAQISDRASLAAQARVAEEAAEERQAVETEVQQAKQKSEEVNEELKRKPPYTGRRHKKKEKEADKDTAHGFPNAGDRPVIPTESEEHDLDILI